MFRYQRIIIGIAALLLAAPLSAQSTTPDTTTRDSSAIVMAAPTNVSVVVISLTPIVRDVPLPFPPRERTSRNTALMLVGGAGMIVGAVVGGRSGNVIMVGGGVVGLIGLWNYLK